MPNTGVGFAYPYTGPVSGGLVIDVARAKQRREEKGLTLKQLALEVGVHYSDLSRWENGRREPRLRHLAAWASALDLQPSDLLRPEDDAEGELHNG